MRDGTLVGDQHVVDRHLRPVADLSNGDLPRTGRIGAMSASESTRTRAAGTFEVDSWEDEVLDEGAGAKVGRTRLRKTFAGDLTGTSVVDMLGVSVPGEDGEFQGVAYV